jgi:hypothetical protein
MVAYIDIKMVDFDLPWRVVDKDTFLLLLEAYHNK